MTVLNGRFLARRPTGVDRMALELVSALPSSEVARMDLKVGLPGALVSAAENLPRRLEVVTGGSLSGHLWEQFGLPRLASDEPILNLCNTGPLLRENQLVVIHDAGTVANAINYTLAFRTWYRIMHRALMRRARVVATVSRFSADELIRVYGRRARGIEIISEGCEHILREPADLSIMERLKLGHRPFVLALGSASPNKNYDAVAAAAKSLSDLGVDFVAAGGGNARVFNAESPASDGLVRTGYVSDRALRALYEHAMCFAFPSLYEGFGLPPLEAMRCGCPVIVSERASLPEVCGEAALYCTATAPATLAAQIRRLFSSAQLRSEMRERGLGHATSFTWERAARQFVEITKAAFG